MSELKAFESERIYWAVEQVEREAGDIDNLHLDDNLFYIKSEADKEIAELEKRIDDGDKDFEMDDHQNEMLLQIVRHQKHKRCLDKAEMCKARYDAEDARVNGHGASWDYTSDEMKYWERWQKRWLELAEKFKEVEK